ncbi:LPD25 domain-containing protein, partial [uncultured Oscillibacter sp.]|uniref:LPD25 domain-containing protein n=1 Tax=uncultured Oscillibacter sp. TaxID=876091 RepID=UPI002620A572
MTISATQNAPVFSTPPLVREPAVAPAEASEPTYLPRELPYIFCEWSESIVFQDKTAYSLSEFDRLMKQADDEYVTQKAAAMAKYGTWQKWYDADDPEYNAFLGYDKVKFTLVMPDGRTFTERQDIGDGDGGVLDFLGLYDKYREIVPVLKEAVRKEAEVTQSAPVPQPGPGPDSGRFWDAYNSIKKRNPDSLILYQVGDFFELYGGVEGDDAWNAAKALDLTLTKRNIPEYGRVSMCGFPARKLEDYVKKLNSKGFDVVVAALEDNRRVTSMFPAQPSEKAKQETDDFSDIDPAAVRAALAENGIVDGHVVDPEKLDANPFIQQVKADVEQIAADTPPTPERFSVIETESGYAIWDDIRDEIYVDSEGVQEEFTSEWQAEDYLKQVRKAVADKEAAEWLAVERAKQGTPEPAEKASDTAPAEPNSYRLLDRLRSDCEYYLGAGQFSEKHLWAGSVEAQISKMREL